MENSTNYYKSISSLYQEISSRRAHYLQSIDELIIESIITPIHNYLDVGAGDGLRSMIIAEKATPSKIVLLDNCADMFDARRITNSNVSFITEDIKYYNSEIKFDLVTCLWNVFGHVGNIADRQESLSKIYNLLNDKGLFIIDINNRYNIKNYSYLEVFKNKLKDFARMKNSGYYPLGQRKDKTQVYIHHPFEFEKMAENVGFKLLQKKYVNYDSGKIEKTHNDGQLFYVFQKNINI